MSINLNAYGNCATDTIGTGSRSCDIKSFGDPTGIALLTKGKKFNVLTDTLDETGWKNSIKAFENFPLIGIYNFEQNTPENEKNTSSTGVMTEIRAGKPQFSFMFDKGGCFHKALYDKRGKNRWDLAILFETGVLMATDVAQDNVKGFDMGMLSVETFKLLQGTDPQMSTAMIQLLDADEFNARFVFLTYEQLGVNLSKIDGVIETTIIVDEIEDTDTAFSAKVSSACNVDDLILGLDETNFKLGGTQATPTTITSATFNATTGKYDFVVTPGLATNDTVELTLASGSYNATENAIGEIFKGKGATEVVGVPSV